MSAPVIGPLARLIVLLCEHADDADFVSLAKKHNITSAHFGLLLGLLHQMEGWPHQTRTGHRWPHCIVFLKFTASNRERTAVYTHSCL